MFKSTRCLCPDPRQWASMTHWVTRDSQHDGEDVLAKEASKVTQERSPVEVDRTHPLSNKHGSSFPRGSWNHRVIMRIRQGTCYSMDWINDACARVLAPLLNKHDM
eukprot:1696310-Amphidinium_carterae.2